MRPFSLRWLYLETPGNASDSGAPGHNMNTGKVLIQTNLVQGVTDVQQGMMAPVCGNRRLALLRGTPNAATRSVFT